MKSARLHRWIVSKFVKREARRIGVTIENLLRFHEVARCDCGEKGCRGWQLIYKGPARRRAGDLGRGEYGGTFEGEVPA